MKKHTGWKKTAAFVLALALVAGAAPANVGTGGLFGGSAIVAYAAEESESFSTNTEAYTYTGDHFKIEVESEGDDCGFYLSNDGDYSATITALNGEVITKIELVRGYWDGEPHVSSESAVMSSLINNTFTFININATSVTLDKCTSDPYCQIKQVKIYYEGAEDISTATVNLASDNSVSSITVGDDTITDLSGFDITYGTDDSHTATAVPTDAGTYYAYVTPKSTNTAYKGTAKSAEFTVTASAEAKTETLLTIITPTGKTTYSETTSGVVSVTPTNVTDYDAMDGWVWYYDGSLSVAAKEGYTITKCVFRQNDDTPITDTKAPFEIYSTDGCITENRDMDGVTSIEVYGYATPAAPTFSNASVTLADDLALNFYVDGIADNTAAAEYSVKFEGECVDKTSALAYNATEGKYYATTHVYAKDINQKITAKLYKGENECGTAQISIADYLTTLAASPDQKTQALALATKLFGDASAAYFNPTETVNDTSVAAEITTYMTQANISDAALTAMAAQYATTFDSDAAKLSLVLDSKTAARLYVKGDETGTASTISSTKADYPSYHEVAGLLPQNLADEQTITVGETAYKFSALTWCNRVLNNTNASTKNVNMAKAIMAYYTAAANYTDNTIQLAVGDLNFTYTEGQTWNDITLPDGVGIDSENHIIYNNRILSYNSSGAWVTADTEIGSPVGYYWETIDVASVAITNAPTEDIEVGETGTLTATVSPDNATDKTVTWSASPSGILTIDSATGAYEAVGTGEVTVTATAGGKTASCTMNVVVPVSSVVINNAPTEALFVNSKGTLTATVSPDTATDKTVVWSSSDPDYVSINAETGEYTVMGKKGYGSATITATATNGTEDTSDDVSAACTITGKVTYTSLSPGTVLHVGDTFYAGQVYFATKPLMSFNDSNGVITLVEDNGCYKFKRGSNGTMPNVTAYKVKDNTDGVYIVSGSGTSSDRFTIAIHTK